MIDIQINIISAGANLTKNKLPLQIFESILPKSLYISSLEQSVNLVSNKKYELNDENSQYDNKSSELDVYLVHQMESLEEVKQILYGI